MRALPDNWSHGTVKHQSFGVQKCMIDDMCDLLES